MNRGRIRQLNKQIQENISCSNYIEAEKCYREVLVEMSEYINSYNPKLEEYMKFLWNYGDRYSFSERIRDEINRIISGYPMKMEERYSLYMLAGNIEEQCDHIEEAMVWYTLAFEIHNAGFVKSKKSEDKLRSCMEKKG